MGTLKETITRKIASLGTRFLPFADAASPDLPLSRLLRLSLFQCTVGMALTLLIGTLNRVMIVEMEVPASIVGIMISLPLLFAPFRAIIGFRSDNHRSQLGWKRVPYIWMGTMLQSGGLSIMPFALLVLAGAGEASKAPVWAGQLGAGLAFLLVGAGLHTVQTVGLALATDQAKPEAQPKVVGLMYVMLLLGMIVSAFVFGALLVNFNSMHLVQVIQAAAVVTVLLNVIALWKQEARNRLNTHPHAVTPRFMDAWQRYSQGDRAVRRLIAVALGTMAFSMEDVILEPYGGQVLHLTVDMTTRLTATLAAGGLIGFALASRVLGRGFDPFKMAAFGALAGIPAFLLVIFAGPSNSLLFFGCGTFLIGFGAGLFGHGTLTATMNLAPAEQRGLALGAWGAAQASAAGVAVAMSGIIRDVVASHAVELGASPGVWSASAMGYVTVYGIEIALLMMTLAAMFPLISNSSQTVSHQRR
jgi:MFS transporter, BCD family, chlorophyll transporter